jgi:trk system potassium uptake protein TrkH
LPEPGDWRQLCIQAARLHARPLVQVARPAVVCRHLGQLALVLAALLTVPAVFAAASADWALAGRLVLAAVLPALALGICSRLPAGQRPLQVNEALAVTALAFLLASALLVYPLMTAGLSPLDAWFEATSGVTTTGLSMVADPQTRSAGFLFARGWAQWFGGLGIVVLSLALAAGRVADMRRLADPGMDDEDLAQGTRFHARRVLVLYAALTIGGFLLVWAAGPSPLQALIHTLSAISTGGFSSQADGLAGFSRQAQLALLLVALLGALPLGLIYAAYARGTRGLLQDPEVRALAIAILAVTAGLWLLGRLTPADALVTSVPPVENCISVNWSKSK